eukprot:g2906.t1
MLLFVGSGGQVHGFSNTFNRKNEKTISQVEHTYEKTFGINLFNQREKLNKDLGDYIKLKENEFRMFSQSEVKEIIHKFKVLISKEISKKTKQKKALVSPLSKVQSFTLFTQNGIFEEQAVLVRGEKVGDSVLEFMKKHSKLFKNEEERNQVETALVVHFNDIIQSTVSKTWMLISPMTTKIEISISLDDEEEKKMSVEVLKDKTFGWNILRFFDKEKIYFDRIKAIGELKEFAENLVIYIAETVKEREFLHSREDQTNEIDFDSVKEKEIFESEIEEAAAREYNVYVETRDAKPVVKKCALLFFGLAKRFNDIVFPSIKEYILNINPDCDVYAHTYDIKSITNPRNNEDQTPVNPLEVYSMTKNVVIDTLDSVSKAIDFEYYHKNYTLKYGAFPYSMDNLLKQWYSIQRVWDSMPTKYERVGLFRLDVLYLNPIDICDGNAVIPDFQHWGGLNDRAFYGLYKWAEQWATNRFKKLPIRSKKENVYDMQGEKFMKYLMRDVPVALKSICFNRVRATGEIKSEDCKIKTSKVMPLQSDKVDETKNEMRNDTISESEEGKCSEGFTSRVTIISHGMVTKTIKPEFDKYSLAARELCVLTLLKQFSWAPNVTNSTSLSITTAYAGEPLSPENIPEDYAEQFAQILEDMKSVGLQHNDIVYPCSISEYKKNELLVLNGRISLVDYGWATINNEVPCNVSKHRFYLNNPNWKPCPDKIMVDILHNMYKRKTKFKSYRDKKRKVVSQRETPNIVSELHLLIDWTCFFSDLEQKIMNPLQLLKKLRMKIMKNKKIIMSNFYNKPVDDFRGNTDFNLYLIKDTNPVYDYRETSKGNRKVNIHLFDLKKSLRKITGGYKIHATDNIQETKDNLKVLNLYKTYYNEKKFDTLQDVFHELNTHPKLKWIVMRNFEGMPNNITIDEHLDVDLLVNDYYLVKTILDGTSATNNRFEDGKNRILNYVNINNKNVLFDFRTIGDNYYDKKLQQDMLDRRIRHPNGFYIPNKEMHLYSLIYHAIIHKTKISQTYMKVFKQYGLKDLEIKKQNLKKKLDFWLQKNDYIYCKPEPSVGYYLDSFGDKDNLQNFKKDEIQVLS